MTSTPPVFVPTAEGAEAVVRAARRRRRLQAAAATGAAAAVILGAAGSLAFGGPSPSADRLDTTNGGVAHSPSPLPSSAATTPPAPLAGSHVAVSVAPRPVGSTTVVPPGADGSAVTPRPVKSVQPAERSPITHGSGSIAADDLCSDNSGFAAFGWCVRYVGPSTVKRGHVTTLSGELCRLASYPAASISFTSTREVDMYVEDSRGTAKWQAGQGISYRRPGRTTTVAGGSCIVWSSPWNTRGPDGFLVPPGDYGVSIGIESTNTNLPSVGTSIQVVD